MICYVYPLYYRKIQKNWHKHWEVKKTKLSKAYFDAYEQNIGLNKKLFEGLYKHFIKNKSLPLKWIDESLLSVEMKGKHI
jgi:hypothetical protein